MPVKTKPRIHNEWFATLRSTGRYGSTCDCGRKRMPVSGWYEYVYGRANKVKNFCVLCCYHSVIAPLFKHAGPCGCEINMVARSGCSMPDYLPHSEQEALDNISWFRHRGWLENCVTSYPK